METFSVLLALCARNSLVTDEFLSQRPVTRSFEVFFDQRLNKRLSKQSRRRWFETPLRSLWRHRNVNSTPCSQALAIGLKMRNISRPWPNLSSSEGSQDTSACQISGHYCHAFSIKYGNHTFETFHWVKMPPKLVKSTGRDQNLIRWSRYSSIWYFRPFPYAFSRKCPKTLNLTRFTSVLGGLCDFEICHMALKVWEPQAVCNHLIKYQGNRWWNVLAKAETDRQTDRRTGSLPRRRMTYTTLHNTEQVTKT